MIQTICEALYCWCAVISHNDATGPQCFWLLKLHVQIILKKLRCAYSKELVFGWHLSMRRPPSAWGRVRACMYVSSIRKPRALLSVFVYCCIEILRSLFSESHHCGCPGANATVIFIPQKLGADTFVPLASLYECWTKTGGAWGFGNEREMRGECFGQACIFLQAFCTRTAVLLGSTTKYMKTSAWFLAPAFPAPDISTVIQHKTVWRRNQVW